MVGLAGCAGQGSNGSDGTTTSGGSGGTTASGGSGGSTDSGEVMQQLASEAKNESGAFKFYTSIPTEAANKLMNEFMSEFGLKGGEVFRSGTFEALSKYQQEAQAGRNTADVISVADHSSYLSLRDQGQLYEYECTQYDHYPDDLTDPKYFAPARVLCLTILWNTDLVNGDNVPKSWAATGELDPNQWDGKVAVGDPRGAGSSLTTIYQLQKTFGEEAWNWIEQWGKTNPQAYTSHGSMTQDMMSGQTPLSLENFIYRANEYMLQDAPIDLTIPEKGVAVAPSPMAITKQVTRPATAKLFMEWALSEAGARIIQEGFKGYTPREPNPIEWEHIPATYQELPTLDMDFKEQAEVRSDIQTKWEDTIGL